MSETEILATMVRLSHELAEKNDKYKELEDIIGEYCADE